MTYLQGENSYRRADLIRRHSVGRVPVLDDPPAKCWKHREQYAIVHAYPGNQGLTLANFSAQRKRFLWDRGCV